MIANQLIKNKFVKNIYITCFNPSPRQNPFNKFIIAAIIVSIYFCIL